MSFCYREPEYRELAPAFEIPEDDPNYSSEDGILFNKGKTVLVRFPTERDCRGYRLPDSVEEIASYAFARCRIETLEMNRVRRVRNRAFWNCEALREVDLGTELTVLTRGMFFACFGLKKLEIPERITEIQNLFAEMCTNLQELTIPRSVRRIGTMPLGGGNTVLYFEYNGAVIHFRDQTLMPGKNGELIDLPYYDAEFRDTSSQGQTRNPYRSLTAFLRLTHPVDLRESDRQFYIHFLRRYLFEFTEQILEDNKADWMRQLLELGVAQKQNMETLIRRSTEAGTTAITALLLNYKQKQWPEKDDEFEL